MGSALVDAGGKGGLRLHLTAVILGEPRFIRLQQFAQPDLGVDKGGACQAARTAGAAMQRAFDEGSDLGSDLHVSFVGRAGARVVTAP